MDLMPQFFYAMVVIGSLSMVGDGGGRGGVGRTLAGCWEGVRRALGGRWRVVRVEAWSLIYRQIKSLHCSGYLLVRIYNKTEILQYNNPQSSKYLTVKR